jgi:hypothetical protein
MSRLRGALTLVAASCALTASSTASTLDDATLKGPIEKGGRAEITAGHGRIDGTPMNRYRWEFRRLWVRCSGRDEVARYPIEGGFAHNAEYDHVGQPWGIDGTGAVGPGGTYKTRVSGRLVSSKKARGWVRVFGTDVGIRGGGSGRCDSGRLHWVARVRD